MSFQNLEADKIVRIKRQIVIHGILTGLLIFIWVGFEYVTGRLFGKPQLGPLYGLLSIAILVVMVRSLMIRMNRIASGQSVLDAFRRSAIMIFIAAAFVVLFLVCYYSAMDPDEYHTYAIEVFNIELKNVLLTSIAGAWIGTMVEGLIISLIVAVLMRNRN